MGLWEGVGRGVRRPPVRLRAASTASLESGHLVFCKRRFPFGDVPDPRLRWGRSGTVETELLFDHVPATYTMILVLNGIFVFHLKQSFFLNINEEVITTIHMLYSIYNYPSALSDCSCVFFLLFLKDLGEKEGRLNHFFLYRHPHNVEGDSDVRLLILSVPNTMSSKYLVSLSMSLATTERLS